MKKTKKMKRIKLLYCIMLIAACIGLQACSDEEEVFEVDWAPVNLYIYAENADGNDLIKEEMEGMTLTYKGETYEVTTRESSRAYLAHMYGLVFQDAKEYSNVPAAPNRLVFGEIDGEADMDEDIVLTWPDGSKNTIHYHCSDHKEGHNPSCQRTWKLDGKEHEGNEFKFVK